MDLRTKRTLLSVLAVTSLAIGALVVGAHVDDTAEATIASREPGADESGGKRPNAVVDPEPEDPAPEPDPAPPPVAAEPPLPPGLHPVVTHDCDLDGGYSVAEWHDPAPAADSAVDVHAIAVYQTTSDHFYGFHPTGAADIYVHATHRPQVMVLASYEPTLWRVHLDEGAVIAKVVLTGYHAQQLSGVPMETEVANLASRERLAYDGFGDWSAQSVSELVGAPATSWSGCYDAGLFSVRPD